jgi:uncharacterized protein YdiU (UPF0061 family)
MGLFSTAPAFVNSFTSSSLLKRLQVPRFHSLGDLFASVVRPSPLLAPHAVCVSSSAAGLLGVAMDDPSLMALCNGELPQAAVPLAMVYSGHQFGSYNPRLGDGRALLLGDVCADGRRFELQLKGGGPTPYSRQGDGRAVLRSSIREFLCSEAMHGLGVPTTRALAMLTSRDPVYREQVETGATVMRVSPCFVRFGSFEYLSHTRQHDALRDLADYVIEHHFPVAHGAPDVYAAFFQDVVLRTARLIAHWQSVGFAHGVMNTDNMSIIGETLDYGPFGFLDDYQPGFICNHSDYNGRYAFDQQPSIGLWNCNALAHALLPLVPEEALRHALQQYQPEMEATWNRLMRAKLGLQLEQTEDVTLVGRLLNLMQQQSLDYTRFFRALCEVSQAPPHSDLRDGFVDRAAFDVWLTDYLARLRAEQSVDAERQMRMRQVNPKYVLRNYLAQQAIERAEQQDLEGVEQLLRVLLSPFDEHPGCAHYADAPPHWGKHLEISCSS